MVLSSQQIIAAGRQLSVPFEVELTLSGEAKRVQCIELLRLVPGRRVVVKMEIDGRAFLAKIFLGPDAAKYCFREQAGIEALQAAGIQTAQLVEQAQTSDKGGELLLMAYLPNVVHLSALVDERVGERVAEQAENTDQMLDRAVEMMARLHAAGLQHKDCHLDNFLVVEQQLYLVDGDAVSKKSQLDQAQALKNLALFFAQLPLFLVPRLADLFAHYCHFRGWNSSALQPQLDALVKQQRAERQRRFVKKIYRDCTQFKVEQSSSRYVVLDRKQQSVELTALLDSLDQAIAGGQLLKDGNSATVAKVMVGQKNFVVKRYNIKSVGHWLKRCWQPSRAWLSWRNAQLLSFYGVATPKPLAMVEQRCGGLRGKAYFITEYVVAADVIAYVGQLNNDVERIKKLARQFRALFDVMAILGISHGDFKGSNFLVRNNALCVIDLDSMQLHRSGTAFAKAFGKDKQRFMKNWSADADVRQIMDDALTNNLV